MLAGWRDLLDGDLQRYGKYLFCRLRTILQMVGCCNLKLDQKVFAIQLARLAQPKNLVDLLQNAHEKLCKRTYTSPSNIKCDFKK